MRMRGSIATWDVSWLNMELFKIGVEKKWVILKDSNVDGLSVRDCL